MSDPQMICRHRRDTLGQIAQQLLARDSIEHRDG
jgi:hypothetical protein